MRRSLQLRVDELEQRIEILDAQRKGDDSMEATALLIQLTRERDDLLDALRDVRLIDDDPFDVDAIEIGDLVTIRDAQGQTESYVLVDRGVGRKAGSDWVSVTSPLGEAILGRRRGEWIEVESPVGRSSYAIADFERATGEELRASDGGLGDMPSESYIG